MSDRVPPEAAAAAADCKWVAAQVSWLDAHSLSDSTQAVVPGYNTKPRDNWSGLRCSWDDWQNPSEGEDGEDNFFICAIKLFGK